MSELTGSDGTDNTANCPQKQTKKLRYRFENKASVWCFCFLRFGLLFVLFFVKKNTESLGLTCETVQAECTLHEVKTTNGLRCAEMCRNRCHCWSCKINFTYNMQHRNSRRTSKSVVAVVVSVRIVVLLSLLLLQKIKQQILRDNFIPDWTEVIRLLKREAKKRKIWERERKIKSERAKWKKERAKKLVEFLLFLVQIITTTAHCLNCREGWGINFPTVYSIPLTHCQIM